MNDRDRLRELDGLRGIAAVAVVAFHLLWQSANLFPSIGSPVGPLLVAAQGVELFFAISGFVIMMTLERSTPRQFVASRISRLYPAYWFAVIITFGVVSAAGLQGLTVRPTEALINLTMLQSYVGVPHVDGVYWTLAVELAFYVQCAALWYSGLLKERRAPVTLAVWLLLSTGISILLRIGPHVFLTGAGEQAFPYIPLFIAGIAVLRIHRGAGLSMYLLLLGCGIALAVLSVWYPIPPYSIVYAGVLLTVLRWRPRMMSARVLVFLGEISYGLYLIHEFIGYSIILGMMRIGVSRPLATTAAVAAAFALACLITFAVDKPLRRPLRRLIAGEYRGRVASSNSQVARAATNH